MVNSACDATTGAVHAFEEQVGSHGGLGGDQNRPFLMYPYVLEGPRGRLVGAEAVHAVLRGWLEHTGRTDQADRPGDEPEFTPSGARTGH